MSYQTKSISASASWEIYGTASFARLLSTTGAVRLEFYWQGSLISVIDNVQGGIWREGTFDRIVITDQSGGANTVEVATDTAHIGYDRVSIQGSIVASAKNATPSQASATVTTTSSTMVAANANRRFLAIQNKDSAGSIYINLSGASATVAAGIKIGPGGYWESGASWLSAAAVTAIGDIASNANIVVVEGA